MPIRIVISDGSCLINLEKVSLLDTLLQLPYEFLISDAMFGEELPSFTAAQKQALLDGGLQVVDLPGARVLRAREVVGSAPQLSVHEGFAFALAESCPGCILLIGEGRLRALAGRHGMQVRGVLWACDEMHCNGLATAASLLAALRRFAADPAVRLPRQEVAASIRRYQGMQ